MELTTRSVRLNLDRALDRSHDIVFDELRRLPSLLEDRAIPFEGCVVVTDSNVARHYASTLASILTASGSRVRVVDVTPGEQSKSIASYSQLLDRVLTEPVDRQTLVIALGGGVVGDLAGFLAASLLRGLPFVQVPTSLVAQVDSAIGGKTGVNHSSGKNLVGAFYQPKLVLIDTSLMQTLPDTEWMDGLSEVVKYGLIADRELADLLLERWEKIRQRDAETVNTVVHRCVKIKAHVVSGDETEQGNRAILNFGHTFGHAIERVAGYRGFTHGQAVALGMRAALHLSGRSFPHVDFRMARELVDKLPAPALSASVDELLDAMQSDKKRLGSRLRFVVLDEIGHAVVLDELLAEWIRDAWNHVVDATT